jgi:hypothetical protein
LVEQGALQLPLLDEKNLTEITLADCPGERLMVRHNSLLEATGKSLSKIEGSGTTDKECASGSGDWA